MLTSPGSRTNSPYSVKDLYKNVMGTKIAVRIASRKADRVFGIGIRDSRDQRIAFRESENVTIA